MAWSPQARAAAAAARRRKGHRSSAAHIGAKYTSATSARFKIGAKKSGRGAGARYTVTAKQAGKHTQFKAKAKKIAKYTAVAGAAGLSLAAAGKTGQNQFKKARSNRIRNDARARLDMKAPYISGIQAHRTISKRYGPNHSTTAYSRGRMYQDRATIAQINRYSKRTPAGKTRSGKPKFK